jgi:timeless protein
LEVFAAAIKLFMELTTPFECLFAGLDFERNEDGAHMLFEHKQFLSDVKNVFLDPRIAKSIMTQLENLLENDDACDLKNHEKYCIVNSITLIRNVLHIPEPDKTPDSNSENTNSNTNEEPISSNSDDNSGDGDTFIDDTAMVPAKEQSSRRQHQVLWNLFAHNLDSVIMSAIESNEFKMWSTPLVQLLALVYKDQHVGTLESLLDKWLESSLSDSSGDDESNTSPQHTQDGVCSSSLLTSTEPNSTDDSNSSDGNGGNSNGVDERSVSSDKGTCGTILTASSPPVSPLNPTLIATDVVEAEKSPKPVQVAIEVDIPDDLSDICKEPPK